MGKFIERNRLNNFGFNEVKILDGNIGYLDLRLFHNPSYAGETAVAALSFLSNSDALIIDLRKNGGGHASMVQLISSYLFGAEPIHLNSFYWRKSDKEEQTWTLPYVPGKRFPNIPVYILTSNFTFSAAEEFSYNLKNLKRATLIGETTGGGAHPGSPQIATDRFEVWVPLGKAINPITKTYWEGSGVAPHIVEEQALALNTAYKEALDKLAESNKSKSAQYTYKWIRDGLQANEDNVELTASQRQVYVGNYGPRNVSSDGSNLFYQKGGNDKLKLVPMGDHKFMIAELPFMRLQFDYEDGQVIALVGHYDNGTNHRNEKE